MLSTTLLDFCFRQNALSHRAQYNDNMLPYITLPPGCFCHPTLKINTVGYGTIAQIFSKVAFMAATQAPHTSAQAILQHGGKPVTVFSLSWCSYCHAVKSLLDSMRVPHQTIELDSGIYLDTHVHQQIRAELRQLSGSQTLPQVFVGSENIGGYTETQAAARAGRLQSLLANQGVTISQP